MKRYILGLMFLYLFCKGNNGFAQSPTDGKMVEGFHFPKEEVVVLNSGFAEARPLISYDGKSLYFSRRYHPKNIKGEKDFQDVWVSHLDSVTGQWSEPENLGPVINNKKRNAIASLSPDGMDAIFFNTYKKTRRMPLVRSRKSGSSWTKPRVIHIDNYVNVSDFSDYFVDFENKVLILAIQADSTVGDQDLYISFLDPYGGWKEPINLGAVVNTEKADFAPFIADDGRALFFCSYGHNSVGGSDIYVSLRLDDSWMKWSEPVNLGTAINTDQEETYFSITGDLKYLYYTSYTASAKDRNILRVELPENFMEVNGPVLAQLDRGNLPESLLAENNQQNSTTVPENGRGAVAKSGQEQSIESNKQTKEGGAALEEIVAKEIEKVIAEDTHQPSGEEAVDSGPIPVAGLSPAAEEVRLYLQNALPELTLEVRQGNDTVEFKIVQNLLYDFNSVYVKSEYLQRLSKMARVLRERPELKIQLLGYTDNIGDNEVNQRVAYLRVENLVTYFKDRRISEDRIEIIGQGSKEPVASNESKEGRLQNRRVETIIRFIEK